MQSSATSSAPTADAGLNAVLAQLIAGARAALADNFLAAYLQGSFAAGDFDQHSDVDFLIVTAADLMAAQLADLQSLHARLFALETRWAQHLEGSYIPRAILWRHVPPPRRLPYLDNGSRALIESDHDDTIVVRWQLRAHGIALAGPPPTDLVAPIADDELRAEVCQTMRTWAADLLARPSYLANRWGQPFVVLSYCRMLHTLATAAVHSKPAGVRWAHENLDPRWHGLIARASDDRPDPSAKVRLPADERDVALTLDFVRAAIDSLG